MQFVFLLYIDDRPLIVQFGANNSSDFINASKLIIP